MHDAEQRRLQSIRNGIRKTWPKSLSRGQYPSYTNECTSCPMRPIEYTSRIADVPKLVSFSYRGEYPPPACLVSKPIRGFHLDFKQDEHITWACSSRNTCFLCISFQANSQPQPAKKQLSSLCLLSTYEDWIHIFSCRASCPFQLLYTKLFSKSLRLNCHHQIPIIHYPTSPPPQTQKGTTSTNFAQSSVLSQPTIHTYTHQPLPP